jgi:2-C-methyl-D-erythritol 2,4-cyclodiphosphate synthase
MRIGYGFDFHNFIEGKDLIIGGINIPYFKGLDGYSDADVLIHAICDALLGAMALGDIGEHFPEQSKEYKDVSSVILLERVLEMLNDKKYRIMNLDTLIIAEEPKMGPFKKRIRENLAEIMNLDQENINIKATTLEGKGAIGKNEAISAEAVVLIEKIKNKN